MANVASGGVGPDAPEALAAIFAEYGIAANIRAPQAADVTASLKAAVDAAPDLLVVLAGDGTARAAAELCGPKGPRLAPLPGGTMNMLPHAIYGEIPWQEALRSTLDAGEERMLGGGEVDGRRFLCAAILGSPALWAPAREAVRQGRAKLAFLRAQRALRRAFTGRLDYTFDKGPRDKAEALVLICPIASRAMDEDAASLEGAALNIESAAEALRLGANALLRDWREDPAVATRPCGTVRVWSSAAIPAILDGETVRLGRAIKVRYDPAVVRIVAPPRRRPAAIEEDR